MAPRWRWAAFGALLVLLATLPPTAHAEGEAEVETPLASSVRAPPPLRTDLATGLRLYTPPLLSVVDKRHAITRAAVPADLVDIDAWGTPGRSGLQLRAAPAEALAELLTAAERAGHVLRVRSAYRSYETQVATFAHWVNVLGEHEARRVSAEPGHSEHQLGTTVDVSSSDLGWSLDRRLGETRAGRWLLAHAHEYGFALSYPEGAEAVTGYAYEPWHYRYVGRAHARAWAESGLTLGRYLDLLARVGLGWRP